MHGELPNVLTPAHEMPNCSKHEPRCNNRIRLEDYLGYFRTGLGMQWQYL